MTRLINWLWKALFYVLIWGADKIPRKRVAAPEASAAPSATESERPFPGPHKADPVTPDRPAQVFIAKSIDEAFDFVRAQMEYDMRCMQIQRDMQIELEIQDMIGPVREGDPR